MKYLFFIFISLGFLRAAGQDRGLSYFLERAKANSPLLKDLQNQISSNQVDSALIKASYLPQVNGISNNSYAPVIGGYGYDGAITNGGQLSALVQASKTFVSKANLQNQYQTVGLLNESLRNSGSLSEQDLIRNITSQYITVYGDMLVMNFNLEILDLYRKEEGLLKSLTQSNIYKQSDYLTFYVSLQQQQLAYRQSRISFKNDYGTLNYIAGIMDTSSLSLADPSLEQETLPDVYRSVFYRQYMIDSLKFNNQKAAIQFSYKPKLNVYADAGYNSTLTYLPYRNFGTSVGLSLIVPIYDGKQRNLKTQKIDISERTRQQYRDFFLSQYGQQIAQLRQQLQETDLLIAEINGQIKYAKTLIDANGKLLETGDVRITDFIIAINTYLNARHLLNQNYISRLQIINQINYWNRK
jgi:outer membrane protein TolC